MDITTPINLNLSEKFKSKSFFHKFHLSRLKNEISSKIRDLREKRDFTQKEFAEEANMKQSAVSRLEQPDYAGWNFKTLMRIAEVLDARLIVDFVPREEIIRVYEDKERRFSQPQTKSVLGESHATYRIANEPSNLALQGYASRRKNLRAADSGQYKEPLRISRISNDRSANIRGRRDFQNGTLQELGD